MDKYAIYLNEEEYPEELKELMEERNEIMNRIPYKRFKPIAKNKGEQPEWSMK